MEYRNRVLVKIKTLGEFGGERPLEWNEGGNMDKYFGVTMYVEVSNFGYRFISDASLRQSYWYFLPDDFHIV